MKKKKERPYRAPSIVKKMEKALKTAVAKAIKDHRRTGDPIVVWKNGRIVEIPAHKI